MKVSGSYKQIKFKPMTQIGAFTLACYFASSSLWPLAEADICDKRNPNGLRVKVLATKSDINEDAYHFLACQKKEVCTPSDDGLACEKTDDCRALGEKGKVYSVRALRERQGSLYLRSGIVALGDLAVLGGVGWVGSQLGRTLLFHGSLFQPNPAFKAATAAVGLTSAAGLIGMLTGMLEDLNPYTYMKRASTIDAALAKTKDSTSEECQDPGMNMREYVRQFEVALNNLGRPEAVSEERLKQNTLTEGVPNRLAAIGKESTTGKRTPAKTESSSQHKVQ